MINVNSFQNAEDFLRSAGAELEIREARNCLVLGICEQLRRNPERFPLPVVLKTVEEDGAPALAAIMTPPQQLVLAGDARDRPGCAAALTDALLREEWSIPGVFGPKGVSAPVVSEWNLRSGRRFFLRKTLRMYELRKVETLPPERGRLRAAGAADFERIAAWWHAARLEMLGCADAEEIRQTVRYRIEDGDIFLWEDGGPVSMACKTRSTRTGVSVGMVFTPPDRRRRGYATACVGELSRSLLAEGRAFCALYADIDNPTSNRIYRRIGYQPIGDYENYGLLERGG